MLNNRYTTYKPGIKKQVVEMALNGSGIRDTTRVLKMSKGTVTSTLKKARTLVIEEVWANRKIHVEKCEHDLDALALRETKQKAKAMIEK